ncbi:hypothetical protein ACFQL5_12925 [Aquipuribacter hungaricus]|uniref:hypothetical protein n=1 Tax=Aquipuribacter hungaricus TaxID=545624 RepID=UPI003620B55F
MTDSARTPYGEQTPAAGGTGTAGSTGRGGPGAPARQPGVGEAGAALRAALRRAVATAALACGVAALVTAVVAFLLVGWPGVWGALIGFAVSLAFLATTALVGARTAGGDPVVVAGWVLGSWLVKVIVVGVVLFLLRDADFYDPVALFVGIVVGMVCTLFAEFRALTSARIPYVDTSGR